MAIRVPITLYRLYTPLPPTLEFYTRAVTDFHFYIPNTYFAHSKGFNTCLVKNDLTGAEGRVQWPGPSHGHHPEIRPAWPAGCAKAHGHEERGSSSTLDSPDSGFSLAPATGLSRGPGQRGSDSPQGSGPMQDPHTALNPASLSTPVSGCSPRLWPWPLAKEWCLTLTTNGSKVHILYQVQLRLALDRQCPPVPGLGGGPTCSQIIFLDSQLHVAHLQGGGALPARHAEACLLPQTPPSSIWSTPGCSAPPPCMTTAAATWGGTCPAWSSKSGSFWAVFTCWRRADSSTLRGQPAFWSK